MFLRSPVSSLLSELTEVGVEPTGTRLSTWPLYRFAYSVGGRLMANGIWLLAREEPSGHLPFAISHVPAVAGPGLELGGSAL